MPRYHTIEDPDDEYIWAKMIENEGVEFHTSRGLPFTYKIKTNAAGEKLGEMIMAKLKQVDEVAYVRFASVYREFKDVDTFLAELKELKNNNNRA